MISMLRLSVRTLAKTPGFTLTAILTLAFGIGLSTSAFSIAEGFLLRQLPYSESSGLVRIFRTTRDANTLPLSPGVCADVKEMGSTLESVCIFSYDQPSLGLPDKPAEQIFGLRVAPSFLGILRVRPVLGRDFAPNEDQPGMDKVVLLSHRGWQRRFGGSPNVLGKTLRLDGESFTIIGVLPTSFDAPLLWNAVEFVRPFSLWKAKPEEYGYHWAQLFGRLKPGVSESMAAAELTAIGARLAGAHPKEFEGSGLRVLGLKQSTQDDISNQLIWLMVGLSLLVLLVACANLANLQLARALGRLREMAIRSALGADRRQIMSPLLAESLLLSLAGGLLGLVFAGWLNSYMGTRIFTGVDTGFDLSIDRRVLCFALSTTLVSSLAFGLIPAWLTSRQSSVNMLKDGARGSTSGPGHNRLRSVLVVAEVTISVVLVCSAASFTFAASRLAKREMGWRPDGVYHGMLSLPWNRYNTDDKRQEAFRFLLSELPTVPGAGKIALSDSTPFFGAGDNANVVIEGQEGAQQGQEPLSDRITASADSFQVLGIPLREGRLFSDDLKLGSPRVVVINESFAKRFWPKESAVGKRFRLKSETEWNEIIGVVGDVKAAMNLGSARTNLQFYRPMSQFPTNFFCIVARSMIAPEALGEPVRKQVAKLDSDLPITVSGSITMLIDKYSTNIGLLVFCLSLYAILGFLISAIGIYGVLTQLANQRTRDIGVRIALGAANSDILHMILRQGVRLLGIGLVLGLLGSLGLNRVMQQSMPGFGLPGIWIQFATMGAIGLISLMACWLPARRASLTDPLIALRAD